MFHARSVLTALCSKMTVLRLAMKAKLARSGGGKIENPERYSHPGFLS